LVVFLAELNGLELWGADVGNAYLEAKTKEKVDGPEFGTLEGHTLLVDKALYGLRSSGLRWHERLADVLRSQSDLLNAKQSGCAKMMDYMSTLQYM
jgi:hypothetical protein